jgi:hypothetical protein
MTKLFKFTILVSFLFSLVFSFVFSVGYVSADGPILQPAPSNKCGSGSSNCGDYKLSDIISQVILFSNFLLGITGSLALGAFIYGGFRMLISAGESEGIKKGKDAIIGAVIGLIIVFASFLIIKFVMSAMGLNWDGSTEPPTSTTVAK